MRDEKPIKVNTPFSVSAQMPFGNPSWLRAKCCRNHHAPRQIGCFCLPSKGCRSCADARGWAHLRRPCGAHARHPQSKKRTHCLRALDADAGDNAKRVWLGIGNATHGVARAKLLAVANERLLLRRHKFNCIRGKCRHNKRRYRATRNRQCNRRAAVHSCCSRLESC